MRRPSRRLQITATLLLGGALASAGGCKRETVTYDVSIPADRLPRSAPRRLVFRGADVPLTVENDGRELKGTFTAAGEKWLSEDLGALSFEIGTPCGAVVMGYRGHGDPAQEKEWIRSGEKHFRPGGPPVDLHFVLGDMPETLLVHVDRREAKDAEVAFGKQVLKPGAGLPPRKYSEPQPDPYGDVYEVAVPACAEGRSVHVAGQIVGEAASAGRRSHVAIDVKGGHCYDRTSSSYSSLPGAAALPFQRPQRERLRGQRVIVFDDGPPPEDTDHSFASCPSLLSGGRMSCTDLFPIDCDAPLP